MEIAGLILIGLGIIEGLYICRELKERNELLRQNMAVDRIIKALEKEVEKIDDRT